MRVLWEFLTMLEGWIGSIWSIDNLDWSLLIWDNSVWFFFAFGLYIGDAVWASSLSLSWSSFLVVLFVLLIRRLTIFNALTFARWYALTVFSPRDLKMKRFFIQCQKSFVASQYNSNWLYTMFVWHLPQAYIQYKQCTTNCQSSNPCFWIQLNDGPRATNA